MLRIHDLPEELLIHIFDCLNALPPSKACDGEVPSVKQLYRADTSLRQVSLVSSSWRRVVFPLLFRHLKVSLSEILPSAHYCEQVHLCNHDVSCEVAPELVEFAKRNDLAALQPSLVVYQEKDCRSLAALGYRSRWKLWQRLLSALCPSMLTLVVPPRVMGDIAGRQLDMNDAWAFKIEHQRLELSFTPSPYSSGLLKAAKYANNDPSPFAFQPWTKLTYHGGSCLPVFGEYHYFEKRPPCLLAADRLNPVGGFRSLAHDLVTFSYYAVFPHLIHMQQLARAIAGLSQLETLTLQLTPTQGSTMLDDLDLIGRGNLNLRDCWTEVERSYAVLISMCHCAGSEVPNTLSSSVTLRDPAGSSILLPALKSFTSLDYQRGILAEELDDIFKRLTPSWSKEAGSSTWYRQSCVQDVVKAMPAMEI